MSAQPVEVAIAEEEGKEEGAGIETKLSEVDTSIQEEDISMDANKSVPSDTDSVSTAPMQSASALPCTIDPEQKASILTDLNQMLSDARQIRKEISINEEISVQKEKQIRLEQVKIEFQNYVQDKLDKISIRSNIIRFKYSNYKLYFDSIGIAIIFASAVLTLVEAIKAEFELEDTGTSGVNTFFKVFPIVISSGITVTAAIMKFKKYQEKMEALSRCIEKAIFTTYRLKRIQEKTRHASKIENIEELIQMYSGEPYDLYLKCQEEMEKCLKYEDLVKHMKTYFDLSLVYQQEEANYRLSRMSIGLHQSRLKRDLKDKIEKNIWTKTWGDVVNGICLIICCCRKRKKRSFKLPRFKSSDRSHRRCRTIQSAPPNLHQEYVETKL